MDILIKVLQFVLSFSLLVIIHELGHFMFARMFGIRVEKFYLFFNPWFSLFKFKKGDTEYGIGWIPFGGYVKIAGMIDESMDTEQMKQPAKSDEFRSKPAWQRLLVMVGGVLMNIVFALCIYIGMSYAYGDKFISNNDVTHGYSYNALAEEIGFVDGDKILTVGGEQVDDYTSIFKKILIDQAYSVEVLRGGEKVTINIDEAFIPRLLDSKEPFLEPRSLFVVESVVEDGAAQKAGILSGDTIAGVNGIEMIYVDQIKTALNGAGGTMAQITVKRDSAGVSIPVTLPVSISSDGLIGVSYAPFIASMPVHKRTYTFVESFPAGIKRTGTEIENYWKQLKMIVSPKTEAYKSLGGVIAIGSIFPKFWSWEIFWGITAFLSIVLAVMNILPIPVLDGGHVMFLLYEVVRGRAPSDKFMERAQTVGLIVLFALLIFANGNDIYRFFIR